MSPRPPGCVPTCLSTWRTVDGRSIFYNRIRYAFQKLFTSICFPPPKKKIVVDLVANTRTVCDWHYCFFSVHCITYSSTFNSSYHVVRSVITRRNALFVCGIIFPTVNTDADSAQLLSSTQLLQQQQQQQRQRQWEIVRRTAAVLRLL